jgi:hypothetical protein
MDIRGFFRKNPAAPKKDNAEVDSSTKSDAKKSPAKVLI